MANSDNSSQVQESSKTLAVDGAAKQAKVGLTAWTFEQNWLLLYCKATEEDRAIAHLANQGFHTFCPKATFTKVRRGKRQQVIEPLFPNYVFIRLPDNEGYYKVRSTRGVIGFVKQGINPQRVPDQLIQGLQLVDGQDEQSANASSAPEAGSKVLVNSASFKNIQAVFKEPVGEKRSRVLLEFMNKPVELEIENHEFSRL